MSRIIVHTPFNIELEFVSAPAVKRTLAVLTDMLLIICYLILVKTLIIDGLALKERFSVLSWTIGMAVLPYLYFPLTEALMHGYTPGKKLLGIKVIDSQGNEPSLSQIAVRWLLGFGNYSVFVLPYLIGTDAGVMFGMIMMLIIIGVCYLPDFICVLVTSKGQRIADIAASTVVIDARRHADFSETIYLNVEEEAATIRYPQVLRLSDRDINGIRNLLHKKASSKTELEYRDRIITRICEVLEIRDTFESNEALLEQLLQDYNLMTRRQAQ